MTKITKAEFDSLPDSLKTKFKADGEEYMLQEEDVTGLKKNKQELLDELKDLKAKYGDIDPDAARKALEAHSLAEEEKARAAGEFDKLKEQLEARHKAEFEKAQGEINTLKANVKRERLTNELTRRGVLPDRVEYLIPKLEADVELVSDEKGFSLKKAGGIGDATEFDAMIESAKTNTPFFFAASGASGSGASGSQVTGTGIDLSTMTPNQMLDLANKAN
jgi:hypothetical protein